MPGAAYAVGSSESCRVGGLGAFTYEASARRVGLETLWDLASLTKVVATTPVAMRLVERGVLDLDLRIADVFGEFGDADRRSITVRNLLLHNSGLPASLPTDQIGEVRLAALNQALVYPTGADTVYSDVGFILLGFVLEALCRAPLDELVDAEVLGVLGMEGTLFRPVQWKDRCAPTEVFVGVAIQGSVHDPTAAAMGGVAGHAGLFSTVGDMARFAQAMLRFELASPLVTELFTTRVSPESSRALGWDTPSPGSSAGSRFGPRSYGHTGFTGTSLWIDPDQDLFAVLLTNRVYPTRANLGIKDLRIAFHDLVGG